jgi:hypothetical protein
MKWEGDEQRALGLRLLLTTRARASKVTAPLLAELEELGLVAPARCAREYVLRPQKTDALRHYLTARWRGLAAAELAFSSRPDTISASALREWKRAQLILPAGIGQINRRTWSAWAGAHSKSGHSTPPNGIVLTTDESLRFRPNAGLQIFGEGGIQLPLEAMQTLLGEVAIPERGFCHPWWIVGKMPGLIITVENRGAFIDFPICPEVLLINCPGRNTALATRFIDRLPVNIPWYHYPDLDPEGLRIALSIHCADQLRRPVIWIPRAAEDLLATHALPLESAWPELDLPSKLLGNPVLTWLMVEQCWLEHEALVLLSCFGEELAELAKPCGRNI